MRPFHLRFSLYSIGGILTGLSFSTMAVCRAQDSRNRFHEAEATLNAEAAGPDSDSDRAGGYTIVGSFGFGPNIDIVYPEGSDIPIVVFGGDGVLTYAAIGRIGLSREQAFGIQRAARQFRKEMGTAALANLSLDGKEPDPKSQIKDFTVSPFPKEREKITRTFTQSVYRLVERTDDAKFIIDSFLNSNDVRHIGEERLGIVVTAQSMSSVETVSLRVTRFDPETGAELGLASLALSRRKAPQSSSVYHHIFDVVDPELGIIGEATNRPKIALRTQPGRPK